MQPQIEYEKSKIDASAFTRKTMPAECIRHQDCEAQPAKLNTDSAEIEQAFRTD